MAQAKRRGWRQGENEWTIRVRFPFVISLVPFSFGRSVSEPVPSAVGSRSRETIHSMSRHMSINSSIGLVIRVH